MELDLSDNAFGPDGVRGFEALLKSSACFTLHELKLNNCGMGIGGGKVGAATPSPTSLCPPPSSLPGPVLCLHPPGVCALGHPPSGMVRLLFFSSKDKGLKGSSLWPVGRGDGSVRVGLPSNHPQFCVALATHRQYCRRAPTCWLCRAQGLGITRPAVPSEQLPEPREAWRVQWRREPRARGHSGRSGHSSPLSLVRALPRVPPLSCQQRGWPGQTGRGPQTGTLC